MFANANLQLQLLALKPTDYFFVERDAYPQQNNKVVVVVEREREREMFYVCA